MGVFASHQECSGFNVLCLPVGILEQLVKGMNLN